MGHLCQPWKELVLSSFNDASIATVPVQEYLYLYVEFNGAVIPKMMAMICNVIVND